MPKKGIQIRLFTYTYRARQYHVRDGYHIEIILGGYRCKYNAAYSLYFVENGVLHLSQIRGISDQTSEP